MIENKSEGWVVMKKNYSKIGNISYVLKVINKKHI